MVIAYAFVLVYGIVLSLAPSVRTHNVSADILWQHWLGILVWGTGFFLLAQYIRKTLPRADIFILPITTLLSGLGLLTIWRLSPTLGVKQTVWLATSILLIFIGLKFKTLLEFLKQYKYLWLTLGLLLTLLTLFFGVNPYGGSGPRLWLKVLNIYFQPSEPLKLLLIAYLSAYFAQYNPLERRFLPSIFPTIIMAALGLLVLVVQRDLGTAIVLMLIYAIMLMVTTQRRRLLWILPLVFILLAITAYSSINIVKSRIDTWLDPWQNTNGSSYQIIQALIAIASGGIFGTGPGMGSPGLVPVVVSDFVFSAIAEELGLLGTIAVTLLFLLFTVQAMIISLRAKSDFNRYLALGISSYFTVQAVLIIGGNLGMLPLTGITLPFLSYGGSSLITNFVCVLLLLKISVADDPSTSKQAITKTIPRLGMLYAILFLAVTLINGYIVLIRGDELILRNENVRWSIYDRYIPRGKLLDANEEILVETAGKSGEFIRYLPHPPLSNTIGYTNALYGQSGLEAALYPYLRGLSGLSFQTIWWHQRLYSQPPPGLDIKLTLNLPMQKSTDALMGNTNGAVILMNAKTGEIYVSASHPYFDANDIEENWEMLISDPASPFLNRVTQGSYPLGTASTPLLLSILRENDAARFTALETSSKLDSVCAAGIISEQTSTTILQAGCSQANFELASSISSKDLLASLERLGFMQSFEFLLPLHIPAKPSEPIEYVPSFFIDETRFLVSPIQMARFAAVLSNQGNLLTPLLTNSYKDEYGNWTSFPLPEQGNAVLDPKATQEVTNFLRSGTNAYWYALGHATDIEGLTITWYIGGTLPEWQGSPLAVAIVLEENNPELALLLGQQLLTGSTK